MRSPHKVTELRLAQAFGLRVAQDDSAYIDLSTSQGKKELLDTYTELLEQVEGKIAPFFIDIPAQKLDVLVDENCGAASERELFTAVWEAAGG